MSKLPFAQRYGYEQSKPIYDDFPESARVALAYLLLKLSEKRYVPGGYDIIDEILRTGRISSPPNYDEVSISELINDLNWTQVYTLCERIYHQHLIPVTTHKKIGDDWENVESISVEKVRDYYSNELNQLLAEENIGYEFLDGSFQRKGRPQTRKNIQRAVGKVLSVPRLSPVSELYNKALSHLNKHPIPDLENCVKDSLIALEACLEILTDLPASKDFKKAVNNLQGNNADNIPLPIAQAMIKLHSYRGSGQGVGHAALGGNKIEDIEAEFILSSVAAFITYLVDLFHRDEDDIPF